MASRGRESRREERDRGLNFVTAGSSAEARELGGWGERGGGLSLKCLTSSSDANQAFAQLVESNWTSHSSEPPQSHPLYCVFCASGLKNSKRMISPRYRAKRMNIPLVCQCDPGSTMGAPVYAETYSTKII